MNGEASSLTRILFVDDSKVMLKTASKILGAEFNVVTAIDGDDAWEKLGRDHDIQVLFTDINMPKCDGYELLKKVRTSDDPGLHNMPVILVTGADDDDSARQTALDRGATDFLNKRFVSTELLPRARAHARYERISRQLQAQSTLDPLTGMANEQGFLGRLEQDIAYARRHGQGMALMRVQIDDLVATYEHRGNEMIDQIVVHVANLIRKRIRDEDTAAHIGLGGFAISLPGGHLDGIEAMAANLHSQAAFNVLEVDGKRCPITLTTAVVSTEDGVWVSTVDALERCEAVLDRAREPVPAPLAPAKAAQQRPAVPAATPARAKIKAPEPAAARTTAKITAPEPAAAKTTAKIKAPEPAAAKTTPAYEPLRRDPPREQPKEAPPQKVPEKTPTVLQRVTSSLRLFGANQRARLARFLKKLGGK
jgi:two-component system cell cycle response regulator